MSQWVVVRLEVQEGLVELGRKVSRPESQLKVGYTSEISGSWSGLLEEGLSEVAAIGA